MNEQEENKINANHQLKDDKQSVHQFKEAMVKTNEIKVGFTKICPNQSTQIKIEIFYPTQVILMTVYIAGIGNEGFLCKASSVPYSKVIVSYDEKKDMYSVRENFMDRNFEKLMKEWGLHIYMNIMDEQGWSDTANWIYLTADILINDLKFKRGHFYTFVRRLEKEMEIKIDKGKNG